MKNIEAEIVGAVHTHTHTSIFIQNGKTRICQEIINRLNKAYIKISFIKYVQNNEKKIGYIGRAKESVKRIKLLHNSLSFL